MIYGDWDLENQLLTRFDTFPIGEEVFSSSSYAKTLTVFSLDALSQCAMNQNTGSLVIVYIAVLTSIFMSMLLFFFQARFL